MKTADVRLGKDLSQTQEKNTINMPFIISATILAFVLAASTFLYFANRSSENEIEQTKKVSAEYDASIAKLKSNRNIAAAEIIQNASSELMKNIRASEAQKYITELQNISRTFKIQFSGFTYEKGKVSTMASAINDTPTGDAVVKVASLIKSYRTGSGNIFELSPVTSVSGQEQKRSFPVEFQVNPNSVK